MRFVRFIILASLISALVIPCTLVQAANVSPATTAETIRESLFNAQLALKDDPAQALELTTNAANNYSGDFTKTIEINAPEADARIRAGLEAASTAITENNASAFAAARAQIWTALLNGSYLVVENALKNNDGATAHTWLALREFRTTTRFSRPNADATLAIVNFQKGSESQSDALLALRADLFDTYQARLNESLLDLAEADTNGFASRRAELAAMAQGYFLILAPAYEEQRGAQALTSTISAFAELEQNAIEGNNLSGSLQEVKDALYNFRAAPLSPSEQSRRAGQLMRYLSLVPIEYGRGVANSQVTRDLEIQEAITFHSGAYAAFSDLENLLDARDHTKTLQAKQLFDSLNSSLSDASRRVKVADLSAIQSQTDQLSSLLKSIMPEGWDKGSTQGDFDVIASMLDQMENAVHDGDYTVAESSRLEAYAILESGPEARLTVLAPQSKVAIEDLFWNGQGEHKGLAYLIQQKANFSEIKSSRDALDSELKDVQKLLSVQSAPLATASNAGIIVFREGLEAVVILASLMGSMKAAETRKYRRPMWWGTVLALLATIATWMLAHGILVSLARYGEKLEAIVSLIAIAVLLLITNWFFHNTYWTNWIAAFQSKKKQLLTGEAGLFLGLISLGFTSVYREGFETVLFLQALVLESSTSLVLTGVAVGLLATIFVGVITFKVQARLPYMNMLIITGVLIGGVLLVMVGKTVHVLQIVGWMPTSPISGLTFPYWLGTWFGTYATWQGITLQIVAAGFVIGSYYLAEGMRKKRLKEISNKQ